MSVDVLMIDDEAELAASVVEYLSAFGVSAVAVGSAEDGLAYLARATPGLILLDVNLPAMNGFTFTRQVRARTQVPILFVSARGSDDDQVLALGVGGDDYITKPFSLAVLLAKVKRVLAREGAPEVPDSFDDGHLRIDEGTGRTYVDGVEVALPAMEHRLLRHLSRNRGRVVGKQELFDHVWGEPLTSDGTLNVHVRRLRARIEPDPEHPTYIRTVWGRGYLFEDGA